MNIQPSELIRHGPGLETVRIWIDRLKGCLSTHHPLEGDELWAIQRHIRTLDYLEYRDPKHTAIDTRTAAKRFENLWKLIDE